MVVKPQIINPQTFVQILHMLVTMCTVCPEAAVIMLTNGLFIGTWDNEAIDIVLFALVYIL